MPANSSGQIAIWQNATDVATFALSPQDTGVRVRETQAPQTAVALPPDQPNDGDNYTILDADGSCGPGHAIVIVPPTGTTIRGAASLSLTSPFAAVTVDFDGSANDWTATETSGTGTGALVSTTHADNAGTSITVAAGPTVTPLATTAPVVVGPGQKALIFARVFYDTAAAPSAPSGTIFTAVVADAVPPTPPGTIFVDATGDTVPNRTQRTVTLAGAEVGPSSTPPLPPGTYRFVLQAEAANGVVPTVDGSPPSVTPGAQLTVEVVSA